MIPGEEHTEGHAYLLLTGIINITSHGNGKPELPSTCYFSVAKLNIPQVTLCLCKAQQGGDPGSSRKVCREWTHGNAVERNQKGRQWHWGGCKVLPWENSARGQCQGDPLVTPADRLRSFAWMNTGPDPAPTKVNQKTPLE